MTKPEDVVRRFQAGPVVPFKPRPGVPTLTIGGKKYVLSTDGGPLGDREDDSALAEEYGDRVVMPDPSANKWRYLWAYDVEKQIVAMWRASDGSEKVWGSARSEQAAILKLDKKGQINRVKTSEFRKIEAYMRAQEQETLEALKRIVEEAKNDNDRQIDKAVGAFFEKLRPKLEAEIEAVRQGVIPIGFKPYSPDNVERQATVHVISSFMRRHMGFDDVLRAIAPKVPNIDPGNPPQEVQWAIDDVQDAAFEKYLPPR